MSKINLIKKPATTILKKKHNMLRQIQYIITIRGENNMVCQKSETF